MIRKCLTCKKEFKVSIYYVRKGGGKFCSKKCYGVSKLGKPTWNKNIKTGIKPKNGFEKGQEPWNKGIEWEEKRGENNNNWKGDNVGKVALHLWVVYHKGKPTKCEHCGKDGLSGYKIHWANTNHKYKRNLDDWLRLCVSCHRKYDIKNNGYHLFGRY